MQQTGFDHSGGDFLAQWLMVLVQQSPTLLAYLVGMILPVVFWRRCPTASVLTLAAFGILLFTSVIQAFLPAYFGHQGLPPQQFLTILSISGIVGGVLRAVATGLILIAIFAGRKAPPVRPA
jgi:hypothetical protein